jgi:hypothetical protein
MVPLYGSGWHWKFGLFSWSNHVHCSSSSSASPWQVNKKQIRTPADLSEATFRVGSGEYADDMVLVDTSPTSLSAALSRLQAVCGRLGLKLPIIG